MPKSSMLARVLTSGKLKAAPIQQLAFVCGVKSSGTKAELIKRLVAAAEEHRAKPPLKRDPLVLSIDLGIRNLGFSILAPGGTSLTINRLLAPDLRYPPRVHLHAWQRRELLGPDDSEAAALDPERFSPASLAIVADQLVRQDILPLKPTHVLIERQRWRSGGAAAIQQWTVRVNTLEAMLHASLRTLREVGHWDGEILSVAPERVARFWPQNSELPSKSRSSQSTKGTVEDAPKKGKPRTKKYKISVLANWLANDESIVLPANQDMEDAIKRFRNLSTRSRKTKEDLEPRKLDDLTDCLLQGVTWLKWEENRALLFGDDARIYYEEPKNLEKILAASVPDDGI